MKDRQRNYYGIYKFPSGANTHALENEDLDPVGDGDNSGNPGDHGAGLRRRIAAIRNAFGSHNEGDEELDDSRRNQAEHALREDRLRGIGRRRLRWS